jgi:hypothetical protein
MQGNSKQSSKGMPPPPPPEMEGKGLPPPPPPEIEAKGSKKGGGEFIPPPVGPSYPAYAGVCLVILDFLFVLSLSSYHLISLLNRGMDGIMA